MTLVPAPDSNAVDDVVVAQVPSVEILHGLPPALSRAALDRALSHQRLQGYRLPSDADDLDGVARYLWNMMLASGLSHALHVFEVTLRNTIYAASLKIVNTSKLHMPDVPCWLDAKPSLLYRKEAEAVEQAKTYLGKEPKQRTAGHLVSKLGLGFWVQLTAAVYSNSRAQGPRLWPKGLILTFPYKYPQGTRPDDRDRENVFLRLHEIREFRNRVAHHEPIWDRNVKDRYDQILDVLGWMNPGTVRALRALDPFPEVYAGGAVAFRERAIRLLGVP